MNETKFELSTKIMNDIKQKFFISYEDIFYIKEVLEANTVTVPLKTLEILRIICEQYNVSFRFLKDVENIELVSIFNSETMVEIFLTNQDLNNKNFVYLHAPSQGEKDYYQGQCFGGRYF